MADKLRLLLISDIHYLTMAQETDPYYPLRKAFIRELRDYKDSVGTIDHVLVSGDIAYKGDKKEYKEAEKYFSEISYACGCPKEQFYTVPGNHDKNFNAIGYPERHLINAGLSNVSSDIDTLFCDFLERNSPVISTLYGPFENYDNFAQGFDSIEPLTDKYVEKGASPYDHNVDKAFYKRQLKSLGDYNVMLYGFNTALNSDWYDIDDSGKGHLLYLPKLAYNCDTDNEGYINIAMMHHPIDRLVHAEEIKKKLDKNFQVQIYGHLHMPASDLNGSIHIHSGAFQPPKDDGDLAGAAYFSVYNIVTLSILPFNSKCDKLKVDLTVIKFDGADFREIDEECKSFEIEVNKVHINRFSMEQNMREVENKQGLPKNVSIRDVRIAFLRNPRYKKYIKDMSQYDDKRTRNENCISFLKEMEDKNRLGELWKEMN